MAKKLISLELKKSNEEVPSAKEKEELKEEVLLNNKDCTKILLRRDTFSKWQIIDPILRKGEIIVCHFTSGSKCFKVGDGVSKFSQLPEIKSVSDLPDEVFIYYATNDIPCIKICFKDNGDD